MRTCLCSPMGQSFLLQLSLSLDFPIHLLPPYWGRGLLHSRVLLLTPPPHVTEQVAHGDQGPQPPSTNKTDKEETKFSFWVKTQKLSHKFSKKKNFESDKWLCGMWSLTLWRETCWADFDQRFLRDRKEVSPKHMGNVAPGGNHDAWRCLDACQGCSGKGRVASRVN